MREITYSEAVSEAILEEMARDERVFQIGEDIGPVRKRENLWQELRKRRIFQTPISESGFMGIGVGAAATGLRPIVVIMYCDFITCAMDQLVNQAAKLTLMSGGEIKLPMVIRTPAGGGTREGAHHSQSLEAWFVHTPGLKVVMPSCAYDAKGLMKSAIRDDNPVVYVTHRLLHRMKQTVPDGEWLVPIGSADVKRAGTDMTVVGVGYAVCKALEAAEKLQGRISLEVVDPRTLSPLDADTIVKSVQKTGRLLVVHEAPTCGGVGAEIVRQVVEKGFKFLKTAPKVLGARHLPMPYSPPLEDLCLPQVEDIIQAATDMMTR